MSNPLGPRKHVSHAERANPELDTQRLKKRIQTHYDVTSDQFLKLWGEHIHHGYFKSPTDSDKQAQANQVLRIAESAGVSAGTRVLDVGCGIGGTSRYLARELGCKVTGITNSQRQVEIARELTLAEASKLSSSTTPPASTSSTDFVQYPTSASSEVGGSVRVLDVDIDEMSESLKGETFDCVWVSEVIFHLHNRQLFFESAFALLEPGGCLVIADICRAVHGPPSSTRMRKELDSIRRNHICPPLGSVDEYLDMAHNAGFQRRHEPVDITKNVARTWEVSIPISLVFQAIAAGRDTIGYVRGMRSMKKAYAHGTAVYYILCFEKP